MQDKVLLSQSDISFQPEQGEATTAATFTPMRLVVITKRMPSFETEGLLLSDQEDLCRVSGMSIAEDSIQSNWPIPPWITAVFDAVENLLQLPEDWDSYGAKPVASKTIENLAYLLLQSAQMNVPIPAVVPTTNGGIQIEWHRQGIDLEIEVPPSGRPIVWFEDFKSGREWEGEINLWDNVLSSFLEPLADRNQQNNQK